MEEHLQLKHFPVQLKRLDKEKKRKEAESEKQRSDE
jgi:hypothetical protein